MITRKRSERIEFLHYMKISVRLTKCLADQIVPQVAREGSDGYFAKFGWSYFGAAVIYREADKLQCMSNIRKTLMQKRLTLSPADLYIDLVSHTNAQDARGTIICIQRVMDILRARMPGTTNAYVFSDKGYSFHNAAIMRMSNGIISMWVFFEAGEGESILDGHFAQVRTAILKVLANMGRVENADDTVRAVLDHIKNTLCERIEIPVVAGPGVQSVPDVMKISQVIWAADGSMRTRIMPGNSAGEIKQ